MSVLLLFSLLKKHGNLNCITCYLNTLVFFLKEFPFCTLVPSLIISSFVLYLFFVKMLV